MAREKKIIFVPLAFKKLKKCLAPQAAEGREGRDTTKKRKGGRELMMECGAAHSIRSGYGPAAGAKATAG